MEVLASTRVVEKVEIAITACCLSFGIGSKDTLEGVAIERTCRLTNDCCNVVGTIDRRSVALSIGLATHVNRTVVRQRLNLVDIVSHGCTNLNIEVLGNNRLGGHSEFETGVVHRAAIRPIIVDTSHGVLEALQSEEVRGVVEEVVEVDT